MGVACKYTWNGNTKQNETDNNEESSSNSSLPCVPDSNSMFAVPREFHLLHHKDQEITAIMCEKMKNINKETNDIPDFLVIKNIFFNPVPAVVA